MHAYDYTILYYRLHKSIESNSGYYDFEHFKQFCKKHPAYLFRVYEFQTNLRKEVIGTSIWATYIKRRSRLYKDQYKPAKTIIAEFISDNKECFPNHDVDKHDNVIPSSTDNKNNTSLNKAEPVEDMVIDITKEFEILNSPEKEVTYPETDSPLNTKKSPRSKYVFRVF
jgi:hypothetical protein